jgi:peptidyl-prolyl cis-trans isomerase C
MNKLQFSVITLLFFIPVFVSADEQPTTSELGLSQATLARQGDVVLTQAEIDAAFSKIPEDIRLPFIRNGEKVEMLVRNILKSKVLANEARKAGYDQETLVKLRMDLAADGELATEWLEKIVSEAPPADYETIAYEKYLLNPGVWISQEQIDVSHILIGSESRSDEDALALANSLYEQLVSEPTLFDSMVAEYSDDTISAANGGRFLRVNKNDMVKPFEEAAFALRTPGEIGAPVKTNYGYHIIRLDQYYPAAVLPFEDIKMQASEQARNDYFAEYRKNYLKSVLTNPVVIPDGAAEEMAKRYFGENLELAPDLSE